LDASASKSVQDVSAEGHVINVQMKIKKKRLKT